MRKNCRILKLKRDRKDVFIKKVKSIRRVTLDLTHCPLTGFIPFGTPVVRFLQTFQECRAGHLLQIVYLQSFSNRFCLCAGRRPPSAQSDVGVDGLLAGKSLQNPDWKHSNLNLFSVHPKRFNISTSGQVLTQGGKANKVTG